MGHFETKGGLPAALAQERGKGWIHPLDAVAAGAYQGLAGVIAGGVCTASGLLVEIPDGTIYFAGQVWIANGELTILVDDDTTTYLWCCYDGTIRPTAAATAPTGYDLYTACLLTKASAAAGVLTIDNTVQHKALVVDTANRTITQPGTMIFTGVLRVPTSAPSSPTTGDTWIDTTTHKQMHREGATNYDAMGSAVP